VACVHALVACGTKAGARFLRQKLGVGMETGLDSYRGSNTAGMLLASFPDPIPRRNHGLEERCWLRFPDIDTHKKSTQIQQEQQITKRSKTTERAFHPKNQNNILA